MEQLYPYSQNNFSFQLHLTDLVLHEAPFPDKVYDV